MTIHKQDDCPAIAAEDTIVDGEADDIGEETYDCRTCEYTEKLTTRAWDGGFRHGLIHALVYFQEIEADIRQGRPSRQVIRRLIREWGDPETVTDDPAWLPYGIMNAEELMAYGCLQCDTATEYCRTEGNSDIWHCRSCGSETKIAV